MKRGRSNLFWGAVATLTGTIIGAGILGIPYVFSKAGLLVGIINIIVLGTIVLFVNLYMGEILLRTRGSHQLPGYAEKYLGKTGKILMLISSFVYLYGALSAYVLGEGEVLSFIVLGSTNYSFLFGLGFLAIMAFLVYRGLNTLEEGEEWGLVAIIVMILILFFYFFPKINISNMVLASPNPIMWFLPYGVVLFACMALSALPVLRDELRGKEKLLKRTIIIGSLIPIVVYLLFSIIVYGFAGASTPEIATIVLGKLPSLFAVFTIFGSFFALGIALKSIYRYDLKLKHKTSFWITIIPVFVIFTIVSLFKLASFVKIMGFVGTFAGGLAGFLILLMIKKAKKNGKRKPEYSIPAYWWIIWILAIIFIAGIAYQFIF